MRSVLIVAGMVVLCAGCGDQKPPFVPVDETPQLIENCKTDWPSAKDLRESCIAAVKSTPHWSKDPSAPKTLADTCKEQFPGDPQMQVSCMDRGLRDQTLAKIKKAERDAN